MNSHLIQFPVACHEKKSIAGFREITKPQLEQSHLTSKEIEVALFIRSGLSSKAIARQLFISVNTVKAHLKQIHSKLGTGSRAELVARLNMQTTTDQPQMP